jgi:hypothetical protein
MPPRAPPYDQPSKRAARLGSRADRLGGGRVTRGGGGVVLGGASRNGEAQRNPQERDDDTSPGVTHWLNPSHCLRLQVGKTWSDG